MGKPTTPKKVARIQVQRTKSTDTILRDENGAPMEHMRLWAQLAAVINGHGKPGMRKARSH